MNRCALLFTVFIVRLRHEAAKWNFIYWSDASAVWSSSAERRSDVCRINAISGFLQNRLRALKREWESQVDCKIQELYSEEVMDKWYTCLKSTA